MCEDAKYGKKKIGFIGLGLIGGSIAKAVRRHCPEYTITAYDTDGKTLNLAAENSVIDVACERVDRNFYGCDYIFLCAPVSCNTEYLEELKKYMHDDCILTDVGSVKAPIHRKAAALGMDKYFIGGHPMAGSERSGFENSEALIIENAYYILTPSAKASGDKIDRYASFVESLKAVPIILDSEKHDYVTAAISHLPHIIAAALVNYVMQSDGKDGLMRRLAAGGFRDITRIASSSPSIWQNICMKNSGNIIKMLDGYILLLEKTREIIANGSESEIYGFFEKARDYRNSIPDTSSGSVEKTWE